jgi:hypothetical protein
MDMIGRRKTGLPNADFGFKDAVTYLTGIGTNSES